MSTAMKGFRAASCRPLIQTRRTSRTCCASVYNFRHTGTGQVQGDKARRSSVDENKHERLVLTEDEQHVTVQFTREHKRKPAQWYSYLNSHVVPLATGLGMACLTLTSALPALVSVFVAAAGAMIVFAINPVSDVLLGPESVNPTKDEIHELVHDRRFKWVLRAYVPLQLAVAVFGYWFLTTQQPTWPVILGVLTSLGTNGAIGFTVAHELVHSPEKFDQNLAAVQLASMCYPHWSHSHLAHHAQVATPEDPASARRNEPLWAFIPRSVAGNVRDAVKAESRRLKDTGTACWSPGNRMWAWLAAPAAMAAGLWQLWGWPAVVAFLGQSLAAVLLLEAVNYVEHYGLTRKKLPSGRYEKVAARHSWNADFPATNNVSFRLQRHADHHMHATRPYQALVSITDAAPQLPYSYPIMVMLALIPPLWFRLMNPILDAEVQRLDALERSCSVAALKVAMMDEPRAELYDAIGAQGQAAPTDYAS